MTNSGSNYQKNEYIKKCKHIIPRIGIGTDLIRKADITESQKQAVILDYSCRDLYKDTFFDIIYENRYLILSVIVILTLLITASILWWEQRKHYISSLEKTNKKLENANADLEKAGHARGIFLSSMSHDLRTPLNGIIGFLNFAIETDDAKKREDYGG